MKQVHGTWLPDDETDILVTLEKTGGFQLNHLDVVLRHVTDWDVAVDVGAHVGTWTRELAKRFRLVYAFEPVPETFACLCANVAHLPNVKTFGTGLADRERTVRVEYGAKGVESSVGYWLTEDPAGRTFVLPLDGFRVFAHGKVGLLKIDVEGMEPLVIQGARTTLKRCRPVVLYEHKGKFARRWGWQAGVDDPMTLLSGMGARELGRIESDYIWGWETSRAKEKEGDGRK